MASGRIYALVLDRAGVYIAGANPLMEILAVQIRDQLDRGGDFSLTINATDPIAPLIGQGNEIRLYREGEGLIFRGIVEMMVTEARD